MPQESQDSRVLYYITSFTKIIIYLLAAVILMLNTKLFHSIPNLSGLLCDIEASSSLFFVSLIAFFLFLFLFLLHCLVLLMFMVWLSQYPS